MYLREAMLWNRQQRETTVVRLLVALAMGGALGWAQSPGALVTFNDDGGWCWLQDQRAIVYQGMLLVGSVAAGVRDPARRGDVEVVVYDLASGGKTRVAMHPRLVEGPGEDYDDHNAPALVVRPDGRVLAVYSKHDSEDVFYYRVTEKPGDAAAWRPEQKFSPSESSRITYSNLHYLPREKRIYNFFRGLDNSFKPSFAWSEDGGENWTKGNVFIDVPSKFRHRPYVRYASDGKDTIHIFYTDGHPNEFANSVYHVFYRGAKLYRSDGTVIRSLSEGLRNPAEGTRVFAGDPDNVAWVSDLHLDSHGRPYVAYSVRKDQEGMDHRYRYARWTGSQFDFAHGSAGSPSRAKPRDGREPVGGRWVDHEIAYAGRRLYPGEKDYTGNIALDPQDPSTVFISTDADPTSGKPLMSAADGKRHYEIFQGATRDGGAHWAWSAVTRDSTIDNIRPLVPVWNSPKLVLLWLRGTYRAYTDYDLAVVGVIRKRAMDTNLNVPSPRR